MPFGPLQALDNLWMGSVGVLGHIVLYPPSGD
jgi:hypothetical protein